MRRVLLSAAALVLGTGAAFAHAHLKTATPAVGSTGPAPAEVVLMFSEGLEPHFSTIAVLKDGKHLETGPAHLVGGDAKTFAVPVSALPAGIYTVEWHATSVDTHKTEGHFTFTVAP